MQLVSTRIITDDVKRLVEFYARVTGLTPTWYTDDFAELKTPAATLAIASTRTIDMFGAGAARPADNHTVLIEFRVDDVDAAHARLAGGRRHRPAADHPTLGQPLLAVPGPRRKSRQFLHAGEPGGDGDGGGCVAGSRCGGQSGDTAIPAAPNHRHRPLGRHDRT